VSFTSCYMYPDDPYYTIIYHYWLNVFSFHSRTFQFMSNTALKKSIIHVFTLYESTSDKWTKPFIYSAGTIFAFKTEKKRSTTFPAVIYFYQLWPMNYINPWILSGLTQWGPQTKWNARDSYFCHCIWIICRILSGIKLSKPYYHASTPYLKAKLHKFTACINLT
jgi:hypothetical protein